MAIPDPNPLYTYLRATQLEGTFPEDEGAWLTSATRVGKHLGWLDESHSPAWDRTWPPDFPKALDLLAKSNRQQCYQRARDANEGKLCIASGAPVVAAFEITAQWNEIGDALLTVPAHDDEVIGVHAACLLGYDGNGIKFVNSWGREWGRGGFGRMSCEYFDACLVEAYAHVSNDPLLVPTGTGRELLRWGRYDLLAPLYPGATRVHGVEVWDFEANIVKGWAFVVERAFYLDVEELFVWPDYRHAGVGHELMLELRRLSCWRASETADIR